MKKMTCKQLGGACDLVFIGETFEELANQSKKHELQKMMKTPEDFGNWFESKKEEFNKLENS